MNFALVPYVEADATWTPVPEIAHPRVAAKQASPLPLTSPAPSPSGPFTLNLSEGASPPPRDPPLARFRIPKSGRGPGVRRPTVEPAEDANMVTHEQQQEPQAAKSIAKCGDSCDLYRPVQPRDGCRDDSQRGGSRGNCKPSRLDGVHRKGLPSPSTTSWSGYLSDWH